MKKALCILLVICLLAGVLSVGASAAGLSFSDVKADDWFYAPVMASAEAGLVAGNADGTYAPEKELSWVETVVFAVRLTQYVKGEYIYGAADQTEVWHSIYVNYALENELISSVPENLSAAITRGESAGIFSSVLAHGKYEKVNELPEGYFTDVQEGSTAAAGIYALAQAGIVNGMQPGVFGVNNTLRRSEVATMVARMANLAAKVVIDPKPLHSELYIEGLDAETVINYFAEVCLDTEFGDKASNQYVRKWTQPIYYRVFGTPSETDSAVLNNFVSVVNTIPGFPGMYPTESEYGIDLEIYFCGERDFLNIMGSDFVGCWGGVTFWYDSFEIYSETIAIRTDIPQSNRNSIIPEEIYNGLGPVQDTTQRFDSIIYQWSDLNTKMSAEDELILKLFYNPAIRPGMGYDECAKVIRELYY